VNESVASATTFWSFVEHIAVSSSPPGVFSERSENTNSAVEVNENLGTK